MKTVTLIWKNDVVGIKDMTLSDELDEWVLENAFKGNGEIRSGGNGLNVYMRVPVYDPETGRPRSIKSETGKLRKVCIKPVERQRLYGQ